MKRLLPALSASALLSASAFAADRYEGIRPGELRVDNGLRMPLRWCPPGEFVMGSPEDEPGRDHDETQHPVRLTKGFWLGQHEVTQGQWTAVTGLTLRDQARKMLADPVRYRQGGKDVTLLELTGARDLSDLRNVCAAEAPNLPMYHVSWDDAVEFCRRLTSAERSAGRMPAGCVFRLPAEAQWEYACRAGAATATYAGSMTVLGENNAPVLNDIAWYGGNSSVGYKGPGWTTPNWPNQAFPGKIAGPRRIGQKKANAWGLQETLGNLYEWVADFSVYYPERPVTDPTGPAEGQKHIFRGGSWNHYATMSRAARRFEELPTFRVNWLGFRVAMVKE